MVVLPHSGAEKRQSNGANMIQDAKQKDKKYKIIKGFGLVDCVQSDRQCM